MLMQRCPFNTAINVVGVGGYRFRGARRDGTVWVYEGGLAVNALGAGRSGAAMYATDVFRRSAVSCKTVKLAYSGQRSVGVSWTGKNQPKRASVS